ncbi:hypothetical protein E3N88_28707 [Mikania micrantha]|uniref:Uncharacterized protein n=1 Tax=Mikania micrantha TaxID=192012 RepID=A0A5N6N181_9ASTR|nr:hypothetical protein E3N88_28707 [Mikania micrantha]
MLLIAVQLTQNHTPYKTHKSPKNLFFMARTQPFNVTNTMPPSIITDHEHEPKHVSDDYYNSDHGCSCFRLFSYFDTRHRNEETVSLIYQRPGDFLDNDGWLMKQFKNMKEFLELAAGPRWKNFIRRFSKKPRKANSPFQYDPESYALNFNDGGGGGEDDSVSCSFSTRFASHS